MTARKINVLACDKPGCNERVTAGPDETPHELRRRATREQGWRAVPSFNSGGHTDLCKWHG